MNKLECQVRTCQHYENGLCCLPGIQIEGPAARECSQTCCDSYSERTPTAGQDYVCDRSPSSDSAIECSAEHCVYNDNCKCRADCVCIGCTCCDPDSKTGTECCTFKQV